MITLWRLQPLWVLSQSLFLEGYLLFLILKFIWKCVTCFPCCSLIVLSFGQEKKMRFYATLESFEVIDVEWTILVFERWDYAIFVYFEPYMRVLLFLSWYIIPLSLLISLSFLKPLSIVFQDGIWSVCFNVVDCARIQRRRKKRIEKKNKKKKKKEKKKKRKVSKRRK